MEALAVSIAKSALNSVVKTATTAISDEIGLLLGVQEELFFIKEELEMMQAFLRAASTEEAKGEIVTTWVKQVQELAYDVEDCLKEASVDLMKKGCVPAMVSSKARDRVARKIQVLKVRIEDVSKRNLRYGLIKSSTKTNSVDFMEKTVSYSSAKEEALLVGLDKPKQELLKLISENHDVPKVISVVGMGGCGKTTLVRNVYESPELSEEFKCLAWVTVVHPFNMETFVVSLARQLPLVHHQEDGTKETKLRRFDMEQMKKNVEYLKRNKYVIVLDDLASETQWTEIMKVLNNESRGSRIIVTTRSESLAKNISQSFISQLSQANIYVIPPLSKDDSLLLFYKAAFRNSDYPPTIDGSKHNNNHPGESSSRRNDPRKAKQPAHDFLRSSFIDSSITEEMKIQADKIIERCGQLPLAIVAIGSFLATRPKTSAEWKAMHDHIASEIDSNLHLEKIKTVLTTSYDGLPYNLKSCFLYFCVFHNHQDIRRSRIVRRWMAEGFLIERRDMGAEEVGERYFYDLMGRSLIQPSDNTIIGNDAIARCSIHGLMYEMIVAMSENENVVSLVGDQNHIPMNGKARHVVIHDWQEKKNNALGSMKLSHVRSVTMFGKVGSYVAYHKMRLLRVLDLEGTLGLKNRDLKRIGKLCHLKYLGLRGTTITELSGSLENLRDLETLDIRNTWVLELPRGIVQLQKLNYLRAGFDSYNSRDVYYRFKPALFARILLYLYFRHYQPCCVLTFLAVSLCPMERNLRMKHLFSRASFCSCICSDYCMKAFNGPGQGKNFGSFGVKAPQGIGKLRSLRNLGMVDIGQSKGLAKKLQYLSNLTKVAITGFSKKNGKILGEVIERLIHLTSLVLAASDELGLSCCLESMKSPPKYLQSLKLFSPINKLPQWFCSLDNLVKLHVRNTGLPVDDIEVIGILSNLKILFALENSFKGEQLCFGPNTFPMLQVMFHNCITEWYMRKEPMKVLIDETALQRLTHLKICDSRWYELEGLQSLVSLKKVVLENLNISVVESMKDMISRNPNKPDLRCLNI